MSKSSQSNRSRTTRINNSRSSSVSNKERQNKIQASSNINNVLLVGYIIHKHEHERQQRQQLQTNKVTYTEKCKPSFELYQKCALNEIDCTQFKIKFEECMK